MMSEMYRILTSRRSVRRFLQKQVPIDILKKCVDAGRLSPSAANLQPLEFIIVQEKTLCEGVFAALHWAAYIKPTWVPDKTERPMAYIIVLAKDRISQWYERDASFAAGNIVHTAEAAGIGSCILCKIEKDRIRNLFQIPSDILIDSVIALGWKAEQPMIEDYVDSVKYYRDTDEVLHVPKRRLEDVMHMDSY
jgi:nitroreductase